MTQASPEGFHILSCATGRVWQDPHADDDDDVVVTMAHSPDVFTTHALPLLDMPFTTDFVRPLGSFR